MKFSLNLTFLRYFFRACQSKSISKAAKENFVSQSAISQAISKLEVALGKQLITHEQNRFHLMPDGQLLLEKCNELFVIFSEIEDCFNETDGVFKGKLSFACTHSFALSLLPPRLGKRILVEYECFILPIPYKILTIFLKNRKLSRNAKMFIDLMCEN